MFAVLALLLGGCDKDAVGVSVVGYNHTADWPIESFSVNDAMGPDVMPMSGGGKDVCCFMLPKQWHTGIEVTVTWTYGRMKETEPQLPSQVAKVKVPRYARPGNIHVHFYDDKRIELVITTCDAEHPLYPLEKKLLLPWKANRTKSEFLKLEKTSRPDFVC